MLYDIARVRRSAFLQHIIFGEVARVHPSRRPWGDGESRASNIDTHSEACVLQDDSAVITPTKLHRPPHNPRLKGFIWCLN